MGRRAKTCLGMLALIAIAIGVLLYARRDPGIGQQVSRDTQPPPYSTDRPRVVVLSPGIAVTLRDLGFAELVVGRAAYDLALDKAVPVCGDQSGLDYEMLMRVTPTHVLLEWGSRPMPERLETMAREHHWFVKSYTLTTLDDIDAMAADLFDRLAPVPAREPSVSSPESTLAPLLLRHQKPLASALDQLSQPETFAKAGRVLLLAATDPPAALGPGSWHHQILQKLGATPAITEGNLYITLDAEDILHLAPDAIVLIRSQTPSVRTPTVDELKTILGRVGTLEIPAVRNGHLAVIDDPLALTPSTAMIGLAEELAMVLEQWSK